MAEIFVLNGVSADGYFEGPGHDISWHHVDDDHRALAIAQLAHVDAILVGRRTYELFASYWPTADAIQGDPEVARIMNGSRKFVVSRTLREAPWANTTILRGVDDVARVKANARAPLAILGSSTLATSLVAVDLVDEVRLIVMPVLLGRGTPHLAGAPARALSLLEALPQRGGNVFLRYRVDRAL